MCVRCGGQIIQSWGEAACLLCGQTSAIAHPPSAIDLRDVDAGDGPNRHLTAELVRAIRRELATATERRMALYRRLASEYATTVGTVRKIGTGETWKEVV